MIYMIFSCWQSVEFGKQFAYEKKIYFTAIQRDSENPAARSGFLVQRNRWERAHFPTGEND